MSYATDVSPVIVDIETAPLVNVRDYIEPPDLDDISAPSNYKDEAKIAAYIEDAKVKRLTDFDRDCDSKAALDFNGARVVAMGWWREGCTSVRYQFDGDAGEAETISEFWTLARHRMIVGFRIREFDLPMLIQRSRYLGVGRYARGNGVTDLYDLLTFNDLRTDWVVRRTAKSFARRFGIPVTDDIGGKDIPALVAAGEWEKVAAHVTSDVGIEVALAKRLGVIRSEVAELVL